MANVLGPMGDGTGVVNSPSLPESLRVPFILAPGPGDSSSVNLPSLPTGSGGGGVTPGGTVIVQGSQQHWGSS